MHTGKVLFLLLKPYVHAIYLTEVFKNAASSAVPFTKTMGAWCFFYGNQYRCGLFFDGNEVANGGFPMEIRWQFGSARMKGDPSCGLSLSCVRWGVATKKRYVVKVSVQKNFPLGVKIFFSALRAKLAGRYPLCRAPFKTRRYADPPALHLPSEIPLGGGGNCRVGCQSHSPNCLMGPGTGQRASCVGCVMMSTSCHPKTVFKSVCARVPSSLASRRAVGSGTLCIAQRTVGAH